MAEYKLYNLKDPKTGQEEPQVSSKEEFDTLKQKLKPDQIKNPRTGQQGDAETVVKEEDTKQADAVNVAKDLAKTLRDALKEHGDEMQSASIKNMNTEGVTIKIVYKPDEQGQQTEDEFNFRWTNGSVSLDNGGESIDLGQIQNKSGRSFIQKDILKDKLLAFLNSHDQPGEGGDTPSDPSQIPDGQPVYENENLWESEECQEAFCNAVTNFRNNTKDKEAIKALMRAARPYQKGNTIQEKLKGAVDWYNWFTENPPKNTKKQVFLEDESDGELYGIVKNLAADLQDFKQYINQSENTHLGSYYRTLMEAFENLYKNYLGWDENNLREFEEMNEGGIEEFMDLDDPIAHGAKTNNPWNAPDDDPYWNDEPVVDEGDEFGPEVGDSVDYEGGHYKLYGYCGYEVVLQNVDDERDFKVVKPADIGMGDQKQMDETEYVDPEQLPDEEDPTLDPAYVR